MFVAFLAGAIASVFLFRAPIGPLLAVSLIAKGADIRFVGFGRSFDLISADESPTNDSAEFKEMTQAFESKKSLSVLSHNLWCHYLQAWYTPSPKKRLDGFLKRLKEEDIDVVFVQELFLFRLGPLAHSGHFEYLARGMRDLGYRFFTDPRPSLPFVGQNSGLCVFSRMPFTSPPSPHSFGVTGELVCTKGFEVVRVAPPCLAGDLHLVTTHMDSKQRPRGVREAQARQIMEQAVSKALGPETAGHVVVAGDFNVCARRTKDQGQGYDSLKKGLSPLIPLYDAPADVMSPTRRPATKFWQRGKSKAKAGTIDHAFVSPSLRAPHARPPSVVDWRCGDGTIVSDHLGLLFHLELASGAH